MSVFISHSKFDEYKAVEISRYLERNDISCYLDVLDPTLQTTDNITATLMSRISQYGHMMVVVTNFTKESWWVPFEIVWLLSLFVELHHIVI